MQIWMDGDACPKPIKEVLYRAAIRTKTCLILVANHYISTPSSPFIKKHQVGAGFDMADKTIVAHMQPGDLVITADIPLADEVVSKGGTALNPRGELYTENNIKQHLARRNLNEVLRGGGLMSGGPAKLDNKNVQIFANSLDRILASMRKT
ncbi:MAG: YaiI/YqxD family protein [Legionellaceae bacterium]|nr:YaiI/YqxD family protein [Legionellaceae bacterium]